MKNKTPTYTSNIINPTNPNELQTKSDLKQIIQEKLRQLISPFKRFKPSKHPKH